MELNRGGVPNQLPFKHQCSLRRLGDDAFNVIGASHEFRNHVAVWIGGEVGAYPLVESGGFPNIEHPALVGFEQIHAGLVGQVDRSQIHGHTVATLAVAQRATLCRCSGATVGMIHEGGPNTIQRCHVDSLQERLLRYLGGFPESLENAWDLPREISLPGLSEAMGVVRSGLNQPLNELMDAGYITVRVAHVIGGGSRRRQVYHITEAGRGWLAEHPETPSTEGGQQTSQTLDSPVLVGRTDELQALSALLREHGKAAVGGLPGVGKPRCFVRMRIRQPFDGHRSMPSWTPEVCCRLGTPMTKRFPPTSRPQWNAPTATSKRPCSWLMTCTFCPPSRTTRV